MTSALILFRQAYARDIAISMLPHLDWLEVRGVVGAVSDVAAMLDREDLDVLIIGPTFIESIDALLAGRSGHGRPRVVVIDRRDDASLKMRTSHHGVDCVITTSNGMDTVFEQLRSWVLGRAQSGDVMADGGSVSGLCAPAIQVIDDTDRAIVRLVASGFADRDIAESVFLSHQTVRNRISRILGDTGARNRTHLACMYLTLVHDGLAPFANV